VQQDSQEHQTQLDEQANDVTSTSTELPGLRDRVECAQAMLKTFESAGFTRDEAFGLLKANFHEVYREREMAAERARVAALPPRAHPAIEELIAFPPIPRPKPPAPAPTETTEQAIELFAATIMCVVDELTALGLERSDAVDIGGYTAYSLAHAMADRLCPK